MTPSNFESLLNVQDSEINEITIPLLVTGTIYAPNLSIKDIEKDIIKVVDDNKRFSQKLSNLRITIQPIKSKNIVRFLLYISEYSIQENYGLAIGEKSMSKISEIEHTYLKFKEAYYESNIENFNKFMRISFK